MATVTKSIGTTGRDYSTITLWEADLDDDTPYDAADDAVGECYNDSAFDEQPDISGGGTLGLNSIKLSVASGERHDGTAGTGARIVISGAASGPILESSTTITSTVEWLEVDGNEQDFSAGRSDCVFLSSPTASTTHTAQRLIVHGGRDAGTGNIIGIDLDPSNAANTMQAFNNVVYDLVETGTGTRGVWGISTGSDGRPKNVLNNTVYGITNNGGSGSSYGFEMHDDADHDYRNNIAMGTGGTTSGTIQDYELASPASATCDYNMASDTSASGANSLDSKVAANQFVSIVGGSEDLHLKTGADALDVGVDLGTTPSGVEIDIDGRDRDAEGDTWDMGAHELVVAATAHYPRNVNFYRGNVTYRRRR